MDNLILFHTAHIHKNPQKKQKNKKKIQSYQTVKDTKEHKNTLS
jgi:hypothetical protein